MDNFNMRFHFIYPAWPKLTEQNQFNLPPLEVIQAAACVPSSVEVMVTDENVKPIDFN